MKLEHFAYQVAEPTATAAWYCEHLGFTIKRVGKGQAQTHFMADESGQVMLEIYCNPRISVPDYPSMDPLTLHLAFVCDAVIEKTEELVAAGATVAVPPETTGLGDTLAMLRDPWGLAIQLCKRANPMI